MLHSSSSFSRPLGCPPAPRKRRRCNAQVFPFPLWDKAYAYTSSFFHQCRASLQNKAPHREHEMSFHYSYTTPIYISLYFLKKNFSRPSSYPHRHGAEVLARYDGLHAARAYVEYARAEVLRAPPAQAPLSSRPRRSPSRHDTARRAATSSELLALRVGSRVCPAPPSAARPTRRRGQRVLRALIRPQQSARAQQHPAEVPRHHAHDVRHAPSRRNTSSIGMPAVPCGSPSSL